MFLIELLLTPLIPYIRKMNTLREKWAKDVKCNCKSSKYTNKWSVTNSTSLLLKKIKCKLKQNNFSLITLAKIKKNEDIGMNL